MTTLTSVLRSISWMTTTNLKTARMPQTDDSERRLTTDEWGVKMPLSVGAFTLRQPDAYLVGDKAFGRSAEMPPQSTLREILAEVRRMTTSSGATQMADHVYFEGLREGVVDGRPVFTVQTGS